MNNGNHPSAAHSDGSTFSPPGTGGAPRATGVEDEASLDFSSIFATLLRRRWIILLTCIVVAGSVAGYTYTLPSVYQASSLVRLDPQTNRPRSISDALAPDLTSELGVLRNSIELAGRVTDKLRATDEADGSGSTFPILVNPQTGESLSDRKVARQILRKTSFSETSDRNIIRISVESRVPEEASTIVNLYAEEYKQFSLEKARSSTKAARQFLEKQAEKQRAEINQLEQQLASFARENELIVQGTDGQRLVQEYQNLKSRQDELSFELKKEQTQLELLRQQLQQFQPRLEQSMRESQQAQNLRSEISALESQIGKLQAEAARYYAVNPDLEGDTTRIRNEFPELAGLLQDLDALQDRRRKLTQQLIDETARQPRLDGGEAPMERIAQLRSRITEKEAAVNLLESQIAALDSEIAAFEPRLDQIPQQRIERNQIERKLNQAESFYQTIIGELQRKAIAEESELGYVDIVRSAIVPSTPVRPNMRQNIILGILLGLGFGAGLAFLREATNTSLRRPADVEKHGYPLLGVVPNMDAEVASMFDGQDFIEVGDRTVSTRLMPVLNPWSSVTENYRLIHTNLKHTKEDADTVLVTSAQQGEGKTTTAVNLALTAALGGQRVLLIDADMRRPTAHEVLGTSRTPGLADLLASVSRSSGQSSVSSGAKEKPIDPSFIRRPLLDNLFFLPAGNGHAAPAKILNSETLRQLMSAVQQNFDFIVIDTPPTRVASDAIVIGSQTKARVLIVSAEEADSRGLDAVVKSLHTVDAAIAGVIFNRFDERKSRESGLYESSYYGSDDYYGYQELPQQTATR